MRIIFLVILFCGFQMSSAQTKNYNTEQENWSDGLVYLKDGKVISGRLNYNFVSDQLLVLSEGDFEQNYSPVSVAYFVLINGDRQTKFHSLPTDLGLKGKRMNGKMTESFFQEIHRNNKYMVLTKHLIEMKNGGFGTFVNGIPGPSFNIAKEKVYEFVYIADRNGTITPVLKKRKSKDHSLIGIGLTGVSDDLLLSNYSQKLESSNTEKEVNKFLFTKKSNLKSALGSDYSAFIQVSKERDWDIQTLFGLVNSIRLAVQ